MNSVFEQVAFFKDSRLPSLFSDFSRLKDINPEGYEANISAWEALLLQCLCMHTFDSTITLPSSLLSTKLASPQYGQPKSLDIVVEGLIKKRVLIPWSIYKDVNIMSSLYADILSPRKLWQKVRASFNLSFYSSKAAGRASLEYFLHWPTLTARSYEILTSLEKKVNLQGCYLARILDFQMFQNLMTEINPNLSKVDIEAVLIYLSRDTGRLGLKCIPGPERQSLLCIIKVSGGNIITSVDIEVLNLKVNIVDVENRVAKLTSMIDNDLPRRLQHMLSAKVPESRLKDFLVRKSQLKKDLNVALSSLSQLAFVLNKIDKARSNETIYESLQSVKAVLSSLNKRVSFADFENIIAQLDSQVDLTDDISDVIGSCAHRNGENLSEEVNADIDEEVKVLEKGHELFVRKQSDDVRPEEFSEKIKKVKIDSELHKDDDVTTSDINNLLSSRIQDLLMEAARTGNSTNVPTIIA